MNEVSELSELTKEAAAAFIQRWQGTTASELSTSQSVIIGACSVKHRIWQDVYHAQWLETALYIKFQRAGDYFLISFKEL